MTDKDKDPKNDEDKDKDQNPKKKVVKESNSKKKVVKESNPTENKQDKSNTNNNTSSSNDTININITSKEDKEKEDKQKEGNFKGIDDRDGTMESNAWNAIVSLKDGKRHFMETQFPYKRLHRRIALQRRFDAKSKRKASILKEISKIEFDQDVLNNDWFELEDERRELEDEASYLGHWIQHIRNNINLCPKSSPSKQQNQSKARRSRKGQELERSQLPCYPPVNNNKNNNNRNYNHNKYNNGPLLTHGAIINTKTVGNVNLLPAPPTNLNNNITTSSQRSNRSNRSNRFKNQSLRKEEMDQSEDEAILDDDDAAFGDNFLSQVDMMVDQHNKERTTQNKRKGK